MFGGYIFRDSCFLSATFSGAANFNRATFLRGDSSGSAGANYNGVTFSGRVNFNRATFSDGAYFANATFSGFVEFDGAIVSEAVYFKGARFIRGAYFTDANFTGTDNRSFMTFCDTANGPVAVSSLVTDFDDAIFSGGVYFEGVSFPSSTHFSGTAFSDVAIFSGTAFSDVAIFSGATFSGRVNFRGATFSGITTFDRSIFSNYTFFTNATFVAKSTFVNAEMKGETSFEGAIFENEPPRFFGAKLHQGTVWRDVKWPPKPKDRGEAGAFIDAYACLKLEMDRLKKHEDELDFFALELQSRRVWLGTWTGLPIAIYGAFSNFGRSYLRPSVALFYLALISTLAFLPSDSLSPLQSLCLSAANTLNVFGFRKDFFDAATIENLPAALKILAAGQTILGTILLFLFGLGVRNKFRMK
ncbi:MAG: pentapeptide repeat-containing protein [Methylocella sp.]